MVDDPFAPIRETTDLLRGFRRPWFIAGGWAIDLFLGRATRVHEDLDVAVFREDQLRLREFLPGWRFTKIAGGGQEPWTDGEWLSSPVHEIHAEDVNRGIRVEFPLNESSEGLWRFRRNMAVTRPVERIAQTRGEIPFLGTEIVLLYKAKSPTPKDEVDFEAARPLLDGERRMWLERALRACHPNHPWIARLRAHPTSAR